MNHRKHVERLGDAKSLSVESGEIVGYAATFNNVDLVGDVIRPGAFQKTIQERVAAGKVPLMALHWAYGGDTREVIGTIKEAKEDEHGLWIRAELSSIESAQDVRTLVQEGHVKNMSIGYNIINAEPAVIDGAEVYELKELRLLEVTVTTHPANELAVITGAKCAPPPHTAASATPSVTESKSADTHVDEYARLATTQLAKAQLAQMETFILKEKSKWKS